MIQGRLILDIRDEGFCNDGCLIFGKFDDCRLFNGTEDGVVRDKIYPGAGCKFVENSWREGSMPVGLIVSRIVEIHTSYT